MLAKQFEELEGRVVSTGEVFDKISKRQVPFEMVAKVFKDLTSEGGKFYKMQEIQADTLKGKISNLKDAYEIMLNEVGQNLEPVMKGSIDTLRDLMANYERIGRSIVELVAVYGTYRTSLALTKVLTRDFAVVLRLLEIRFNSVGKAIKGAIFKNPYAIIAAGATAAAYAMYKVIDAWTSSSRIVENYNRNMAEMEAGIASETAALDALYAKLNIAKEGTKDYDAAKRSIYSKYSEYIVALKEEGAAVDDLAAMYDKLKQKVQDAAKEKFLRNALSDADSDFAQETERIYKDFVTGFKKGTINITKGYKDASVEQKEALWQYITGGLTRDEVRKYVPDLWAEAVSWLRKDFEEAAAEYKQIVKEIGELPLPFDSNSAIATIPEIEVADDNSDAIEKLQKRIALLEKLRDVYESMRPYFSDEQIREFFSANFGFADKSLWENFDFADQMDDLIGKLAQLGERGLDAANAIREKLATALSKDLVNAQSAAIKAADALNEYLGSWNIGDETMGKGAVYKVTKIVSDYQKAVASLNDKRDEAIDRLNAWVDAEKKAGRAVSETAKAEKESEIADKFKAASANLLNKATGDVRKTAEEYVKEWAAINGIDLSNWSHKTIFELNKIQSALNDFDASNLPQEIVEALKKAGIDIETFKQEVLNAASKNANRAKDLTNERKWGYILKSAKALAGAFDKIGEVAKASGNSGLLAFANGMAESFTVMGDIAEKVAKQDYVGAIISGVTSVASAFLEAAKNSAELGSNIRAGRDAAEQLRTEIALSEGVNGVFGEDKLKSISNAWEVAAEKFKVAAEDIAKAREKLFGGSDNDTNGWAAGGGVAAGAALGAAIGGFFGVGIASWLTAPIGALIGAAVGLVAGGLTDIALETDNFQKSIEEMAKELNAPLINEETGLFNIDTLNLILEKYDQLDSKSKEVINNLISHTEDYEKAIEQLSEGMEEIFGNVADDIASKIVDAFKASGEAALDYADTIDEVASSLAQMVIKSALIDEVFDDKLAKRAAKEIASGNVDKALALMDEAMLRAQELAPSFQEFLAGIQQYMQIGGSEDETLAGGIKSITEDTANLLASYLNAIRADVSYSKAQRDSILAEIKNLSSYVSSPTIVDYLNRIQANTFNTAESTRAILSDLRSMMTSETGQTALRVLS